MLENDGQGRLREHVIDHGKESHLGTLLFDLDGDGDLDILSVAWDEYRFLHLWRNDAVKKRLLLDLIRDSSFAPGIASTSRPSRSLSARSMIPSRISQPVQPAGRYPRLPVIRPGHLPADGRCRVGIIPEVRRFQDRRLKTRCVPEAPQHSLQALDHVAGAPDVRFPLDPVIGPARSPGRSGLTRRPPRVRGGPPPCPRPPAPGTGCRQGGGRLRRTRSRRACVHELIPDLSMARSRSGWSNIGTAPAA